MNKFKEQFDSKLKQLNEDAGRGRGIQAGNALKSGMDDFLKSVSYDYLNRAGPIGSQEAKYNFNNYYTLDIRLKNDELMRMWETGAEIYEDIFSATYKNNPQYKKNLLFKLRDEYRKYFKEAEGKSKLSGKSLKVEPLHEEAIYWRSLETALADAGIRQLYDEIPVVSIFSPTDDEGRPSGQEGLAIKEDGFVPLIMNGMISAARGHVPQGVTIEEILEGKFSRKAIAPEQGTFINRVKDPTSDKDFEFRSWKAETLEELHNIIMNTFKRDKRLQMADSGTTKTVRRGSLFLYMKQEDFNKFEKGGKGFSDVAKGALKYVSQTAETPDF